MDDFASIFTILIFLFYAVIAGAFVIAAMRMWAWPFVRERLPARATRAEDRRVRSADREHSASQP